jgi:hypothetical protein
VEPGRPPPTTCISPRAECALPPRASELERARGRSRARAIKLLHAAKLRSWLRSLSPHAGAICRTSTTFLNATHTAKPGTAKPAARGAKQPAARGGRKGLCRACARQGLALALGRAGVKLDAHSGLDLHLRAECALPASSYQHVRGRKLRSPSRQLAACRCKFAELNQALRNQAACGAR